MEMCGCGYVLCVDVPMCVGVGMCCMGVGVGVGMCCVCVNIPACL